MKSTSFHRSPRISEDRILTGAVFGLVALKPELAKDDLFKTLAQAVVVQGLVGLAMASWFTIKRGGSSPTETTPEKGE
ncbi:hypothetical protein ACIPPQ_20025 [Sphingopyxis sp. LARHCG72]